MMNTAIFIITTLSLIGMAYASDEEARLAFLLDPELAAKIFAAAALAQGTLFTLAPFPQAEAYGWAKADPAVLQHTVEFIGASILSTGIAPACALWKDTDVLTAIGITMVFWSVFFLRSLLNGTHSKAGLPTKKLLPVLATALVGVYCGFVETDWALTYFKLMDIIYSLVALQIIIFPEAADEFWEIKKDDNETGVALFLGRTFGYFHLQYRIQSYCLESGVKPEEAMAYGAFSGFIYFLVSFFVNKDIPKIAGKPAAYMYAFWLTFFSLMILSILAV